jgi:hypothetical protein
MMTNLPRTITLPADLTLDPRLQSPMIMIVSSNSRASPLSTANEHGGELPNPTCIHHVRVPQEALQIIGAYYDSQTERNARI